MTTPRNSPKLLSRRFPLSTWAAYQLSANDRSENFTAYLKTSMKPSAGSPVMGLQSTMNESPVIPFHSADNASCEGSEAQRAIIWQCGCHPLPLLVSSSV